MERRGLNIEIAFEELFRRTYPEKEIQKSSKEEDMFEHFDFLIEGKKYELKSLKKIRRSDSEYNQNIVYVEFQNVRGAVGWVNGSADFIILERNDEFVVIRRKDLKNIALKKLITKNVVLTDPRKYYLYSRENRKDLLTYIDYTDIESKILSKIKKDGK